VSGSIAMCVFVGYRPGDFGDSEGQHSSEKDLERAHASMDGPLWVRKRGWAEGGGRKEEQVGSSCSFQGRSNRRRAPVCEYYITCSLLP
jgi:hypothetical protein